MLPLEEVFKPKWYLNVFTTLEDARSFAIAHGWRANPQKVQVRQEAPNRWVIEPYEKDCGCANVVPPF